MGELQKLAMLIYARLSQNATKFFRFTWTACGAKSVVASFDGQLPFLL